MNFEELLINYSGKRMNYAKQLALKLALKINKGNRTKTATWLGISVRSIRDTINENPDLYNDFTFKHFQEVEETIDERKRLKAIIDRRFPHK